MKKLFSLAATSLLVALPLLGTVASPKEVQAYDPVGITDCGTGLVPVDIHFHTWDEDYSAIGVWSWNLGNPVTTEDGDDEGTDPDIVSSPTSNPVKVSAVDDFGAVIRYCVNPASVGDYLGFLPTNNFNAETGTMDWNAKMTRGAGDGLIPMAEIKADVLADTLQEKYDFYAFEGLGGGSTDVEKSRGVYYADPTKKNIILAYYDPSGAYEENLGIHPWGPYDDVVNSNGTVTLTNVPWAQPAEIFEDGSVSPSGVDMKTVLLTTAGDATGLGGLIYAGDDATKKHDATANSFVDPFGGFATMAAGEVAVVAVANEKIFGIVPASVTPDAATYGGDLAAFAEEAFKFELSAFEAGEGTHAVNPETVIVKTNIAVPTPADAAAAIALFELKDASDAVVEIESVNYSASGLSTNAFVLNLGSSLDNSKVYTLTYKGFPREAELVVDLDNEAPVIDFTDEAVVELELGAAWDSALIPDYSASDNRDGDITGKVYIPAGEGSFNTGVVGEYPITLKVVDAWGNEGTATFTIKVVEPEVAAGCAGTAAAGANNGLGYLLAFVLAGFIMKKALVK